MNSDKVERCDILVSGTGYYAEVMLADMATTVRTPLHVVIGGRNEERQRWLVEACRARAVNYGTPVSFSQAVLDSTSDARLAETLDALRPRIVVQSASVQSPWQVDIHDSEWSRLVAQAGFGLTIAFNALLSFRTATAIAKLGLDAHFVNTCYPDGVNQVLAQAGLPITTGVGNISIFHNVIGGRLPREDRAQLRVLAHHRHIVEWRKPPGQRAGDPVRAWVGGRELGDIDRLTHDVQLPYRELNLISGAGAVPVLLALAGEGDRRVHVPGPGGLPGGYPVVADASGVALDLPPGLSREDAVAWNRQFEDADGVSVRDGQVRYAQRVIDLVAPYSREIASGFAVAEVEEAVCALESLRVRLGG